MARRPSGSTERYRDEWAATYRNTPYRKLPWFSPQAHPFLRKAVEERWLLASARVLEVGCGAGTHSIWLAQQGFHVTGVDIAPGAIESARRRGRARGVTVDFRVADVLELPFPSARFGAAADIYCFHSLPIDRRDAYASELSRVIRPGGRLVLSWIGRETTGAPGPRHRPSLAEVATALEGRFFFRRLEVTLRRRGPWVTYQALLERRRAAQPPLR